MAAGMMVVGATPLRYVANATAASPTGLDVTPIKLSTKDAIEVPGGYTSKILIRRGDPLFID